MTIITKMRWLAAILTTLAIVLPNAILAQANGALACNDLVQITLDAECNGVTPDMFLEGDPVSPTPILYNIEIDGPNGVQIMGQANPLTDNPPLFKNGGQEISYPIGGPYQYTITAIWQNNQTNTCWGNVIFEANLIPQFTGGACAYDPLTMTPQQVSCEIICGEDPWSIGLSTEADIAAALPTCIDGNIKINTTVTGNDCDGQFHEVSYVLEVVQHGMQTAIPLFTEAYWERPISLNNTNCASEAMSILDLVPGTSGIDQEEALLALMGMPTDLDGDGQNGLSNIIDNWIQPDGELTLPCDADYSPQGIIDMFDDPYTFPPSGSKLPHITEWVFLAYPWFFTDLDGDGMLSSVSEIQPIASGNSCNLSANYTDSEFPICGNNKKVVRQWSILDWCSGTTKTCEQLIVIGGEESPVFSPYESTDPIEISTQPWTCQGCFTVPDLDHPISNKCGTNTLRVTVDLGKDGIIQKQIGEQICIEEGEYTLTYVAINGCGTTTTLDKPIIVRDLVPPVPVCEDEIVVSLTPEEVQQSDGGAKIFSESFDNGSHDAGCGPVWYKVIRLDELNGTRHGYWNLNNAGIIPVYSDYPENNPASTCSNTNGDDWQKCNYDCDTKTDYTGDEYSGAPWANDGIPDNDRDCSRETGTQIFFDDFVKFCCADVEREILVVLRVYDMDPGAGPIQPWRMDQDTPYNGVTPEQFDPREECTNESINNDLAGRFNDCMIRVKIQLKNPTVLICPDDVGLDAGSATLSCEDDSDPALNPRVGTAEAYGLCGDPCISWYDVSDDVAGNNPSCGERILYRAWFIDVDCDGELGPLEEFTEQCNQLIYIQDTNDFDPNSIKWPVHYIGGFVDAVTRECNPNYWPNEPISDDNMPITEDPNGGFFLPDPFDCVPEQTCEPEWDDPGCGLVGSSVSIDTIYFEDDSCVKILKDWAVIDWCTWEPNATGSDQDPQDAFEFVEDWTPGECEKETCSPYYARYTSVDLDGYYTYSQVIKVINTTAPMIAECVDVCIPTGDDCLGDLVITNSATDSEDCASDWLKWTAEVFDVHWELIADYTVNSGNGEIISINVSDTQGGLPVGTYRVNWTVSDGCNNVTSCMQLYTITDKKAPTPYCIQNLSTATMSTNGSVEIWASDYNLGSEDNCTGAEDLLFSFSGEEYQPNIEITCLDISNGISETFQLEMWVWDETGNRDFCNVTLRVDDNQDETGGTCDDRPEGSSLAVINGSVVTPKGDAVQDVEIELASNQAEYPKRYTTDSDGLYAFDQIALSNDYTLSASKKDSYINGVSTIDLVLIQRHILGLDPFQSPYQMLAADLNNDNNISASDLIILRKLILGTSQELPNGSWMFINANQELSIQRPYKYNSNIALNDLSSDSEAHFMGIKFGDVNGTAVASNLQDIEPRSNGIVSFTISDQDIAQGSIVNIPVYLADLNVSGFQFTLLHPGLDFVDIVPGTIDIDKNNIGKFDGSMTMSWNNDVEVSENEALFNLVFRATQDVKVSDALRLTSDITRNEAYVYKNLEMYDLELSFDESMPSHQFELYQNEPNPFSEKTSIGFYLPEQSEVTIRVRDYTGKEIVSHTNLYSSGYSTFMLTNDKYTPGVYFYSVESNGYSDTKKMIIVD